MIIPERGPKGDDYNDQLNGFQLHDNQHKNRE